MGPRRGETKVPLKGIFIGAKVVRGHDWDWSNQDGGEGENMSIYSLVFIANVHKKRQKS